MSMSASSKATLLGPILVSLLIAATTIWAVVCTSAFSTSEGDSRSELRSGLLILLGLGTELLFLLVCRKTSRSARSLERSSYAKSLLQEPANRDRLLLDFDCVGVLNRRTGKVEVLWNCPICQCWVPPESHKSWILGGCVGEGNRASYASFLIFSSLAWMCEVTIVSLHLYEHLAARRLQEARIADWPLIVALAVAAAGAICSLASFGVGCIYVLEIVTSNGARKEKDQSSKRNEATFTLLPFWRDGCCYASSEAVPLCREHETESELTSTSLGPESESDADACYSYLSMV